MDQQEEENKYVSIIEQLESMKLIEDLNLKLITLKKTKINFLRNHILDIKEKKRIELMENDKLFDIYHKNEVNYNRHDNHSCQFSFFLAVYLFHCLYSKCKISDHMIQLNFAFV